MNNGNYFIIGLYECNVNYRPNTKTFSCFAYDISFRDANQGKIFPTIGYTKTLQLLNEKTKQFEKFGNGKKEIDANGNSWWTYTSLFQTTYKLTIWND